MSDFKVKCTKFDLVHKGREGRRRKGEREGKEGVRKMKWEGGERGRAGKASPLL